MTLNKKLREADGRNSSFVSKSTKSSVGRQNSTHRTPSVKKDLKTIIFLIFIYFLQAIPLGLDRSIPMILSSRNITYDSQGTFSLAFWPFSMKLLWAPFVDTCYSKKLGRRKSWILPMNFAIGVFFLCFAKIANDLLNNGKTLEGMFSEFSFLLVCLQNF
jgi:PAT family acetyl-CoA transporter-like MFS transporter 1